MKKLKQALIAAVCVALASQFQFSPFVPGFIITLSVIVFALMLYHYEDVPPMLIAGLTALISPFFRGLTLLGEEGLAQTWKMAGPDIVFYLCYGVIYQNLYVRGQKRDLRHFAVTIFWCDFISNVVELSVRTSIVGLTSDVLRMLLIFAFCRTLIVLMLLMISRHYRSFLVKEEHEIRYRNLIMLSSKFKSEIYFMHKNMAEIEDVMKKSFEVYRTVSASDYPEHLKELTLDIAKDVHEIKKEYIRVIEGLEEITEDRAEISAMTMRDIAALLKVELTEMARRKSIGAQIEIHVAADFLVKEHFYLVSVLKNLLTNGLEALESRRDGVLTLRVSERGGETQFCCTDNGIGIKKDNMPFLFNPGFSTKFDHKTGNIGRGIGLTLVRDIVTDKFNGKIDISVPEGGGARFVVSIPTAVFQEAEQG